jgi:hypothetical protein
VPRKPLLDSLSETGVFVELEAAPLAAALLAAASAAAADDVEVVVAPADERAGFARKAMLSLGREWVEGQRFVSKTKPMTKQPANETVNETAVATKSIPFRNFDNCKNKRAAVLPVCNSYGQYRRVRQCIR